MSQYTGMLRETTERVLGSVYYADLFAMVKKHSAPEAPDAPLAPEAPDAPLASDAPDASESTSVEPGKVYQ
jgi:hypothetical protein